MTDFYDSPQWCAIEKFWKEPDSFREERDGGYVLAARRGLGKAWCGYVGVPAGHSLHSKGYDSLVRISKEKFNSLKVGKKGPISVLIGALSDPSEGTRLDLILDVHGGVTWAADHVPGKESDGLWWFGFDCHHYGDLSPYDAFQWAVDGNLIDQGAVYRDLNYVKAELENLLTQLRGFEGLVWGKDEIKEENAK